MSEFTDFLQEVFIDFGPLQIRPMFGGHGVFHDGLMIGLVADDVLYLKVDEHNDAEFDRLDLPAFSYQRGDKVFAMSYRQAPDTIYDERDQALLWANSAMDAARRKTGARSRKNPAPKAARKRRAAN